MQDCRIKEPGSVAKRSRWWLAVQIALSVFIFSRASYNVFTGPLDTDETYTASRLGGEGAWKVISPVGHHRNHAISTLSAHFSKQIFGLNEITVRYPSIVFCAAFLLILNFICWRIATPFTTLLIFSNLLVNQLAMWFMHSMRGYLSMMLFTIIPLTVLLWETKFLTSTRTSKKRSSSQHLWFFSLFFVGSFLTHTFGGVFSLLLWTALLVWLFFNRSTISGAERRKFSPYLVVGVLSAPLLAILLVSNLQDISSFGYFYADTYPEVGRELLRLVGIGDMKYRAGLILFLLGLLSFRIFVLRDIFRDFLSVFLLVSVFTFACLIFLFRANMVEGRMFLAFLVPLLLWVGDTIYKVKHLWVKVGAFAAAYFLFVLAPHPNDESLFNVDHEILGSYNTFIKEVRRTTNDFARTCLTVSGHHSQVYWAKSLYLSEPLKRKRNEGCRKNYHIHFGYDWGEAHAFRMSHAGTHRLVYHDGSGRVLFEYEASLPPTPGDPPS